MTLGSTEPHPEGFPEQATHSEGISQEHEKDDEDEARNVAPGSAQGHGDQLQLGVESE